MSDSLSWLDGSLASAWVAVVVIWQESFREQVARQGGFNVNNMQFSYLCTCAICERSNAKSGQVIVFSFNMMAVNLHICCLGVGRGKWAG